MKWILVITGSLIILLAAAMLLSATFTNSMGNAYLDSLQDTPCDEYNRPARVKERSVGDKCWCSQKGSDGRCHEGVVEYSQQYKHNVCGNCPYANPVDMVPRWFKTIGLVLMISGLLVISQAARMDHKMHQDPKKA